MQDRPPSAIQPAPSTAAPSHGAPSTARRVLVNTASLAGSSLWRIFISFILQILITRVLGVAAFGQYVSALAYLNVAQVVSELGLTTLLVRDLAPAPTRRRAYFRLALRLQLAAALATWAALVLLAVLLPVSVATRNALWLAGASLPFYAVTSAAQTLFKASERMELVMSVEATINTLIMGVSIGVLLMGGGVSQLIGVLVATQAVSALLCLWLVRRQHLLAAPQEDVAIDLRELWRSVRPFYWLSLADVLLHRLDILLLNVVTTDLVTGLYSIAYSIVRVGVKLIQSFWQALYPTLSRLHHQATQQYSTLSRVSLRYGLMAVLPIAGVGTGVAGGVLTLLYGQDAEASIRTLQILLWLTPLFLVEMYGVVQLMVVHKTRASLTITWVHIGAVLLLLPALTILYQAEGAALAMVAAGVLGVVTARWLAHQVDVPFAVRGLPILVATTVITTLVAFLLPLAWPLRAVIATGLYAAVMWITGVFAPGDRAILRKAWQGSADSR